MNLKRTKQFTALDYGCLIFSSYILLVGESRSWMLGLISVGFSIFFILSPEYLLPPIFLSALMSENCFILGNITTSRYMTLLFLLACCLQILRRKTIKVRGLLYSFILIVYLFCSTMLSPAGYESSLITIVMNILLAYFVAHLSTVHRERVFRLLSLCCILFVLYIGKNILQYGFGALIHSGRYDFLEGANANVVAMSLCQIAVFCFSTAMIYFAQKKKRTAAFFVLFALIGLILLALSGARSALVGVIGGVGIIILLSMKNAPTMNRRVQRLIILGFFLLIAGLIFIQILATNEDLANRFSLESVLQSGGTGRTTIWSVILRKVIPQHFLFGVGYSSGNIIEALWQNGVYHSGAHNIVFAILASIGVVGFLMLAIPFFHILRESLHKFKEEPLLLIPISLMVSAVCNGIGENIYAERFFWLDIGLCLWVLWNQESSASAIEKQSDKRA